jgi:steroid Delta-isomerase
MQLHLRCRMILEDQKFALARMAGFFQEMSAANVGRVRQLYAADATFHDPINEVTGVKAIEAVMADLFHQLKNIRIVVREIRGDEDAGCLLWTMHYQFRGNKRSIPGVSHFRFNSDGLVTAQEDFWDASFVLYGEFPILGMIMRGIKRMAKVKV